MRELTHDQQCLSASLLAKHLNGACPNDGTEKTAVTLLQTADCCRKRGEFDLAETTLNCLSSVSSPHTDKFQSDVEIQRSLIANKSTEIVPPTAWIEKTSREVVIDQLAPVAKEPPPIHILGWNFAKAMAKWVISGFPTRTKEEIEERLAICQSCEYLVANQCRKCGCACKESNKIMNKLAIATEVCPIGRWK